MSLRRFLKNCATTIGSVMRRLWADVVSAKGFMLLISENDCGPPGRAACLVSGGLPARTGGADRLVLLRLQPGTDAIHRIEDRAADGDPRRTLALLTPYAKRAGALV